MFVRSAKPRRHARLELDGAEESAGNNPGAGMATTVQRSDRRGSQRPGKSAKSLERPVRKKLLGGPKKSGRGLDRGDGRRGGDAAAGRRGSGRRRRSAEDKDPWVHPAKKGSHGLNPPFVESNGVRYPWYTEDDVLDLFAAGRFLNQRCRTPLGNRVIGIAMKLGAAIQVRNVDKKWAVILGACRSVSNKNPRRV